MLAFFLNAVIDQRAEAWLQEHGQLEAAEAKIEAMYATQGVRVLVMRGAFPRGMTAADLPCWE